MGIKQHNTQPTEFEIDHTIYMYETESPYIRIKCTELSM